MLDNERYAETGMQHSHTAAGVRIDRVAAACGFAWTAEVGESAGVEEVRGRLTAFEGPGLAVLKVAPTDLPRVLPPIDAVYLKHRLRLALGFAPQLDRVLVGAERARREHGRRAPAAPRAGRAGAPTSSSRCPCAPAERRGLRPPS